MGERIAVIGPPGTGKTHSLMDEIGQLLHRGVKPEQICAVTFTRVAAREIRKRLVDDFPQYEYKDFPWVGTLHSLCKKILGVPSAQLFLGKPLAEFCDLYHYKFSPEKLREAEEEDIEVQEQMLTTTGDWFEHFDSRRRNAMHSFEEELKTFCGPGGLAFVKAPGDWMPGTQKLYCERKAKFLKDKGYWDFTALLEEVLRRKLFPPGVRYIFCDEAQDNSPLLWCVLRQWAETCERFTALGDPDQAIYDFLPADPTWFLKFIDSARRVELKQSYRLPRRVQAVSETWIKQNKERVDRAFYPRDADGQVKGRCHLSEFPWDEYAVPVPDEEEHKWVAFVLSRTRWQANQMKSWFLEKGIPFAVNRGTMNPLQTSKGRLVYAIVRLAEGEKVPAGDLKGVLRWVPAKPWMQHGGKTHFREFIEGNREQLLGFQDLMWNGFTPEYLDTLDSGDFLKPLKFTITEKAYLRRCYDRFGKFVFLNIPNILVTNIHGIKGMEAEYVILDPTLSSNPWQSMQNTPEEERRVGYTGITRASKGLFILEPNWASAGCYNFPLGAAL